MRAITDDSAGVVQTYQTDEFGAPTQTQGISTNPFQYTGEQRNAESGFVYLRARVYDPVLGRFLQRDPFAGASGDPLSLNRFTYVKNNPINNIDPTGLKPQKSNVLAGPGNCIQLGAFPICLPTFQTAPPSKDKDRRQERLEPCPGEGQVFHEQAIRGFGGTYIVIGRGPESGTHGCHINVSVSSGKTVFANWHAYYTGEAYKVWDMLAGTIHLSPNEVDTAGFITGRIAEHIDAKDPMDLAVL